jgi:hypothetical protein
VIVGTAKGFAHQRTSIGQEKYSTPAKGTNTITRRVRRDKIIYLKEGFYPSALKTASAH